MWSCVYPVDTLRVLKQTTEKSYIEILKSTRIKNYYKGIPIVILRSVPSSGLGMVSYEYSRKVIKEYKDKKLQL